MIPPYSSVSANDENKNDERTPRQILFSILIPVYNEQAYLALVIDRVMAAPLPEGVERELVLVDDCSTDRSPEIIETLVQKYPGRIRAFRQPKNQGKGAAIRRAIKEMTGDFAIIQDADLEYDPNEYSLVLAPLLDGRADVVYGSRFATRETRKVLQYHHKLGNLFLTHLSNFATGLDLTDMETCYKAFRADALKSIPLRSNRFGIEPEITAKIAKRGWTVYEVPISYNGRRYSEGKKIGWKDGVSAIRLILKYWFIDDSFYDEDSDSDSAQQVGQSKRYGKLLVKRAAPYLGMKTLELGAGLGAISRFIPQKERLTVTEADDRRLKFLNASYDGNSVVDVAKFDPRSGETSLTDGDKGAYDSVVCFNRTAILDVDVKTELERIRNLLNDEGRFVAVLPARKKGDSKGWKKTEIQESLARAGFVVEKLAPIASIERVFLRRDPKRTSQFGFIMFEALVGKTRWLDALLPPTRFFVVASKTKKEPSAN
ncbi:MAG: glycosyltransferase [Thermoguttaceae bacterium]|nr:glycosyltransferase [Thermoguttaceae bacterium]